MTPLYVYICIYMENQKQGGYREAKDKGSTASENVDLAKAVRVGNVNVEVVRESIAIGHDGILSFDVETNLSRGAPLNVKLQTGLLLMDNAGSRAVNFRFWTDLPGKVGFGGLANFAVAVNGITGPAYLRIIPDYVTNTAEAPVVTNFGPGQGNFIPCDPCNSRLNYDQAF